MSSVNVIIQNRQTTETPPASTVISFDCETDCPMSMDLTGYCKSLHSLLRYVMKCSSPYIGFLRTSGY